MKPLRFAIALCLFAAAITASSQQPTPPKTSPPAQSAPPAQKPSSTDDPCSLSERNAGDQLGKASSADEKDAARRYVAQKILLFKSKFEACKDPLQKGLIADMLLGLGVKDGPYWDYLANRAREALKDPSPVPFDFDGRGEYSKKFIDWANKHHKSGKDAIIYSMTVSVVPIAELIPPKDPRAIPILREALQADNVIIQTTAAKGLAALHDTASIPAIIHACQSSPKEGAEMIAEPLVFFSDPAAQHAVDLYVPEEMAKELREAVAQGKTPFNLGSDRADAPPH